MRTFVYIIRAPSLGIAKVGVTADPKGRFGSVKGAAPATLELSHVFEFQSTQAAAVWEKRIFTHANRNRDHGEWVIDDEKLVSLIAEMPRENETARFFETFQGRPTPKNCASFGVQKIRENIAFMPKGSPLSEFVGAFPGAAMAIITTRLAQGYGVEDIAVKDGIDVQDVRDHVAAMRESGTFRIFNFNSASGKQRYENFWSDVAALAVSQ